MTNREHINALALLGEKTLDALANVIGIAHEFLPVQAQSDLEDISVNLSKAWTEYRATKASEK